VASVFRSYGVCGS